MRKRRARIAGDTLMDKTMIKKDDWIGKEEETTIEYEVVDILSPIESTEEIGTSHKADYDPSIIKADKLDCAIAASSGFLTGMLDVFWVGEFSLADAQANGRKIANNVVIKTAKSKGYQKDSLEGAIRFLEKNFPNPSDKVTANFGGGLQHHLRDYSHHPTPYGLICSILTQFTSEGHGAAKDGSYLKVSIVNSDAIGDTFEEKILFGVVNWAFHLISDMSGSSQNPGAGTGIPGPLLATLKEATALPFFRNITVDYKDDEIPISAWISKLFNGTAFPHDGPHDLIRFDLRTELGIKEYQIKQSVPVIVNQCIVRGFYLIRRFILEIQQKNVSSIKDLKKLEPRNFLPKNSRSIARMMTIATGVFSLVDAFDSGIRAAVRYPDNRASFTKAFLFRINFYGIASFAFAIRNDAHYIISDVNQVFTTKTEMILTEQKAVNAAYTIEVKVEMDNTNLYAYTFHALYEIVAKNKVEFTKSYDIAKDIMPSLFYMGDDNFAVQKILVDANKYATLHETERLIIRLLEQNNIPYESGASSSVQSSSPFLFICKEDQKRIGYIFSLILTPPLDYKSLEATGVDGVKVVSLINPREYLDTHELITREAEKKYHGLVEFLVIEDFFELFGPDEFSVYMKYAEQYNNLVRNLIGFITIVLPSEEAVCSFRDKKTIELSEYSYKSYLPAEFDKRQEEKLVKNYFNRGLYKAMTGTSTFADSFIGSEWYYGIYKAAGNLEQTAVVVGYLKSVEQLLYSVIRLSIGHGKTIKAKGSRDYIQFTKDNENFIDNNLGPLIGFMKYFPEIFDVNSFVKQHIIDTLDTFRDKCRNEHLHKDNVYLCEEIEEIRKQAHYIYYLILGGCKINDDHFVELGISMDKKSATATDEVPQYSDFEKWLDLMLGFDPHNAAQVVYFCIDRIYEDHLYKVQFTTTTKYEEKGYDWVSDISYPFVTDSFDWKSDCSKEEAQEMLIGLLMMYLEKGKHSSDLKKHDYIVAGNLSSVECVYKNQL